MGLILLIIVTMADRLHGGTYSTNFSSYDSTNWELAKDCEHCSNKNQCTQESVNAVSFGPINGSIITTSLLSEPTKCGALCQSGHMTYTPNLLYCHIKVIAKWYPTNDDNKNNDTYTAEGFIGFDSASNVASVTFGFHGDNVNWPYNFTTDSYANHSITPTSPVHHATKYNLAESFNTFEIIWTKDSVEWLVNRDSVQKVTDKSLVPQIPMQLRLHIRSNHCSYMSSTQSFHADYTYFECITN